MGRVVPAEPTVEYRIGARVPDSIRLYSVPREVAVEAPQIGSYKYYGGKQSRRIGGSGDKPSVEEVVD